MEAQGSISGNERNEMDCQGAHGVDKETEALHRTFGRRPPCSLPLPT
jgi:hypothetical protein